MIKRKKNSEEYLPKENTNRNIPYFRHSLEDKAVISRSMLVHYGEGIY